MKFALNDQPIKIDRLSLPTKKVRDGVVKTCIIDFTIEGGNRILDLFDPELIGMFYKPVVSPEDQLRHKQIQIEDLDEAAPMPLLRSTNIKWPVALKNEYTGYKLTIDHGLGDHSFGGKPSTSNIVAPETTIKGIRWFGKEGGSVKICGRALVVGMSGADIGKMSDFIKLETKASAEPPQERQAVIDGTKAAFEKDHPGGKPGDSVVDAELEAGEARGSMKPRGSSRAVPPARKTTKAEKKDAAAAATDAFVASQTGAAGGQPGAAAH